MNPTAKPNDNKEYAALINEYDDRHLKIINQYWVIPTRVYRKSPERQQIEFKEGQRLVIRENWPGAATFTLYRRF